ncbi:hypothetical protein IHE45_05G179200 [Dioscorea alata]|uniref:Uncharacterized protein n=1 Tax=Dioscorea alata TaxID=55571 RepID=A0ACB7W7L1_DIOAL|nr:hypothetical protein IHE45_05G179200 [Dioscorea alata]
MIEWEGMCGGHQCKYAMNHDDGLTLNYWSLWGIPFDHKIASMRGYLSGLFHGSNEEKETSILEGGNLETL